MFSKFSKFTGARVVESRPIFTHKFNITLYNDEIKDALISEEGLLNDQIINFYYSLLIEDAQQKPIAPSSFAFNTHFYPQYCKRGYESVSRWTKKVKLFSLDVVLVPIHLKDDLHWCLASIHPKDKIIYFYDSLQEKNNETAEKCFQDLLNYLDEESRTKYNGKVFDRSEWRTEFRKDTPCQGNGTDCGVLISQYAKTLLSSQSSRPQFHIKADETAKLRKRMAYEILEKKIIRTLKVYADPQEKQENISSNPDQEVPSFSPVFREGQILPFPTTASSHLNILSNDAPLQQISESTHPLLTTKQKPRIQTKLKVGFNSASIRNNTSLQSKESPTSCSIQESQIFDDIDEGELSDDFVKPPNTEKCKLKKGKNCSQEKKQEKLDDTLQDRDWNIKGVDTDTKKILQATLPLNYNHLILAAQPYAAENQQQEETDEADIDDMQPIYQDKKSRLPTFSAHLRLNIKSKEEALEWLEHYKAASYTDWRVYKTYKEHSPQLIYKIQLRCHHDTRASNPSSKTKCPHEKHTDCRSRLILTVKNYEMKRSSDRHLKTYPCEIRIRHWHNHRLRAADSLKHRRPLPQVQQLFHEMFRKGHTPSSALNTHKFDLKNIHGNNFYEVEADGAQCPSIKWCYYQYYRIFRKEYGDSYGQGMVSKLEELIQDYNSNCGKTCAKFYHHENDLLVVICSPMMQRTHELLRSSGEIVFMDFTGGMDRYDTRVGCLATHSVAGGLPLGIILSTSETEIMITKGLEMLTEVYPEKAFFSRGKEGPQIIMTDDSLSERNSVKNLYPSSVLLLCIFHILQAFLRYVTDSNHHVKKENRGHIVDLMKKVVYASTEEEFEKRFKEMINDNAVKDNPILLKHLKEDIYPRAKEWAICYRMHLRTRGNNTNNYIECMFRQLKDLVLLRVRAFNVVQLFDFLTTRLDSYLESRIASVLNGRNPNISVKYRPVADEKLNDLIVSKITDTLYTVENKKSKGDYIVDMECDLCSCFKGQNGGQCKHQYIVAKKFDLHTQQFFECLDESEKMLLHKIMTGNTNVPEGWYGPLRDIEIHPMVSEEQSKDISNANDTNEENSGEASEIEAALAAKHQALQDAKRDECKAELEAVFNRLNSALENNPDQCLDAIQSFTTIVNAQKTDSALFSTLFLFKQLSRKNNGINVNIEAIKRRKKLEGKRRLGATIKVSTEAVKRRTTHLGGRKCQQTGRPPKSAFVKEHGYTQSTPGRSGPMDPVPSKGKAKMPHSFAEKVNALKQEPSAKRAKRK